MPPLRDYLVSPVRPRGLTTVLILFAWHEVLDIGGPVPLLLVPLWAVLLAGIWRGAPRIRVYALVACAAVAVDAQRVLVQADGPQDADSTRDESAEQACGLFLAGQDPWGVPAPHGNPMTTGPASVLLLSPAIALAGGIGGVTLAFWVGLLAVLLAADLTARNGTFAALALLQAAGAFGVAHTQFWSLDELFFPFLLLAAAYWFVKHEQPLAAGILLACAGLWRANHVPGVIAFAAWAATRTRRTPLAAGGLLGVALVGLPFVLGGHGLSVLRPFGTGWGYLGGPDRSVVGMVLEAGGAETVPASAIRAAVGAALLALAIARLGRSWRHPFAHVTLAGAISHGVVWHPADWRDYTLMIVVPALLWMAHTAPGEDSLGASP